LQGDEPGARHHAPHEYYPGERAQQAEAQEGQGLDQRFHAADPSAVR
jgi:hypothetical protein